MRLGREAGRRKALQLCGPLRKEPPRYVNPPPLPRDVNTGRGGETPPVLGHLARQPRGASTRTRHPRRRRVGLVPNLTCNSPGPHPQPPRGSLPPKSNKASAPPQLHQGQTLFPLMHSAYVITKKNRGGACAPCTPRRRTCSRRPARPETETESRGRPSTKHRAPRQGNPAPAPPTTPSPPPSPPPASPNPNRGP